MNLTSFIINFMNFIQLSLKLKKLTYHNLTLILIQQEHVFTTFHILKIITIIRARNKT